MNFARRIVLPSAALALTTVALHALAVGTRRFELGSADDFKGGELNGVAVGSDGTLRPGWDLGAQPVADVSTLWAALAMPDGSVLLGTGNEGKLVEMRGGVSKVLAETKALAVTSLTQAWGGAVVLGTLPEGKVMKWHGGKLTELVTLKDTDHVWAVAFDKKSNVVYAATGPQGKLWRIEASGNAQVYFDAEEDHLMSLAVGPDGAVYAGASDNARLYKVTAANRASVLYDFNRTEVRAIAVAPGGVLYAIANELSSGSFAGGFGRGSVNTAATPSSAGAGARGRGILVKLDADGTPDTLFEDSSEHFVSLTLGEDGKPLVGTGAEGRVYRVEDDHSTLMLADVAERQITGLVSSGKQQFVVASDPAVLRPVRGLGGADAVWTSKVLDAGIRARYGRLAWDTSGKVELSTRSGNTSTPDATWSAWSKGVTAPALVGSPSGRFFQVRARFNQGPGAELSRVEVAFVTDNLRPTITGIDASSGSQRSSSGGSGVQSSGGSVQRSTETRVNLSWRVDNPDQDELRYRLHYRPVGGATWYELLKPGEKLTAPSYAWDVSSLPEGRYKVRVSVSDEPSNPPERVKRHERESNVIVVDTSAPTLEGLKVTGKKITGIALDGASAIQRIEAAVAGTEDWAPFAPLDGIFDELREEFELDVSSLVPQGGTLVSVRVFDQAGNMSVRSVSVR